MIFTSGYVAFYDEDSAAQAERRVRKWLKVLGPVSRVVEVRLPRDPVKPQGFGA